MTSSDTNLIRGQRLMSKSQIIGFINRLINICLSLLNNYRKGYVDERWTTRVKLLFEVRILIQNVL